MPSFPARPTTRLTSCAVIPPPLPTMTPLPTMPAMPTMPTMPTMFPVFCAHRVLPPPPLGWLLRLVLAVLLVLLLPSC